MSSVGSHRRVETCHAYLGIQAGQHPVLLGHGHKLGAFIEEHSQVALEEAVPNSLLLQLLTDAAVWLVN